MSRGQALDIQVDGLGAVVGGPGDEHLRQVEFIEPSRRADGVEGLGRGGKGEQFALLPVD